MKTPCRKQFALRLIVLQLVCVSLTAGAAVCRSAETSATATAAAREILASSGIRGGFVLHLGSGDGQLTAALRANEAYTVQGLEADSAKVQAARAYLTGLRLYGPVSVDVASSDSLPYADNVMNLVVVSDPDLASDQEITRVLAPAGVVCRQNGAGWQRVTKPRPDTMDEWSHFLHDSGNNPVACDEQVGPPRCLQWVAPPLWLRSHETPSGIEALVSSGNRIFYFFDEGLVGITDQRLPERWALLCRDAFNGKLLWRRPVDAWGWPEWADDKFRNIDWTEIRGGRTVVPVENQRRLVAEGDRLYATLSYRAPLSILDAATGEVLSTVQETGPVTELLASEGTVLAHSRAARADAARRRGKAGNNPSVLTAVAGQTGRVLWRKETPPLNDMFAAIDAGHIYFQTGATLNCWRLADGERVWQVDALPAKGRALIAHAGAVVLYSQDALRVFAASTGELLWERDVPSSPGAEADDLFIAEDLVWRGMIPVDDKLQTSGKSPDVLAIAYDLKSGEERKRVHVRELRSPEHHHRCYRNKATERFLISGMEGAEFLDLVGQQHDQNNWLRGACRLGVMPCNGLLYVPADQCFCQPGAKLLGFTAVAAEQPARQRAVPDDQRLEKGPAYGSAVSDGDTSAPEDWSTFRYGPSRHATTPTSVPAELAVSWTADLGGRLTQPIAVGDRVYVALCDAHAVVALDARTGQECWRYFAGARVDSPPTFLQGTLLVGSADGYVHAIRAADGIRQWRFLAAPHDRRIGSFDQLESVWPVHGSVLIRDGVAYFSAGRSTYLDGGIRVYAVDALSGKLLHQSVLSGPFPDIKEARDVGFFVRGANSDVLVSEGEHIYMRQKKLTTSLGEVNGSILSSKGEQDVGLHVFSTAGLLDDSGYNRVFWMYSGRWPGFQLANQAPKAGQLLVVDEQQTYAVNMFYRRNVHSPLYFPGKEGYLLFADRNSNEPQIVGEAGARPPVAWLPQSHIPREGQPGLDSPAFGLDKMIGYTRAEPPVWATWLPIRVRAMVKAADLLFVAGAPDDFSADDPYASFEGRERARLACVTARDGQVVENVELEFPPIFDGLIAARNRLYVALENGKLVCLAAN